jgi:hypothetical protein
MALPRGDTSEHLVQDLVASGAPAEAAETIVRTLVSAGLSTVEARDWIAHPNRAYPHDWPMELLGSVTMVTAGSMWLIEQGHAETVVSGAREFAAADAYERTIARLFGGNIAGARRLTGGDPARAAVIADIAETLAIAVEVPENVCYVGQTRLPRTGGRRIVDRLVAGEEAAVQAELARGEIDPRQLLESEDLIFIGW